MKCLSLFGQAVRLNFWWLHSSSNLTELVTFRSLCLIFKRLHKDEWKRKNLREYNDMLWNSTNAPFAPMIIWHIFVCVQCVCVFLTDSLGQIEEEIKLMRCSKRTSLLSLSISLVSSSSVWHLLNEDSRKWASALWSPNASINTRRLRCVYVTTQ